MENRKQDQVKHMQHFLCLSYFLFFSCTGEINLPLDILEAAFELKCFINGADNEALVRF